MDELIFQILSYVGFVVSIASAAELFCSIRHRKWETVLYGNLLTLGIVYTLAAFLFGLAALGIDGFAIMSPFAKYMRPLIIFMEMIPAMITHRMVKQ